MRGRETRFPGKDGWDDTAGQRSPRPGMSWFGLVVLAGLARRSGKEDNANTRESSDGRPNEQAGQGRAEEVRLSASSEKAEVLARMWSLHEPDEAGRPGAQWVFPERVCIRVGTCPLDRHGSPCGKVTTTLKPKSQNAARTQCCGPSTGQGGGWPHLPRQNPIHPRQVCCECYCHAAALPSYTTYIVVL